MNKLLAASSLIAISVIATQARADDERWPRWYVGLNGGVTFLSDTDIKGSTSGKVSYKDGWDGNVALGYMPPLPGPILNNMRIEAQLGYYSNELDSIKTAAGSTGGMGALKTISYMGNLFYDFRNSSQWTPYIGAGVGVARDTLSRDSGLGNTGTNDSVFAYQGMVGISYAPTTIPMTEWSIGYRYFGTASPEFNTATAPIKLDREMASSAEVGAKFRF